MLAATAKSLQSCLTLCDPIDGSPPGSLVPGILQARTLEWVAISFSSVWKWKVKVKSLSRVWLLATPWTVAHQVPLSMGFSRQEYWSGVPLPYPYRPLNRRIGSRCYKALSLGGVCYTTLLWQQLDNTPYIVWRGTLGSMHWKGITQINSLSESHTPGFIAYMTHGPLS